MNAEDSRFSASARAPLGGVATTLLLVAASLMTTPALAYWELIPVIDIGATWEDNPRYVSDQEKAAREAATPGIADSVFGAFVDLSLRGAMRTPTNEFTLTPRVRKLEYFDSNTSDLDDDNFYVNASADHAGARGTVGLDLAYRDTGVRTREFIDAIPDDPDAPPPVNAGSGRFRDSTQQTWELNPSLTYQLSPRNAMQVSATYVDTTYDEPGAAVTERVYLDYSYSSVDVGIRHFLNEKNSFTLSLNGGGFLAQQPGQAFENSTDSFGLNATYDRTFSETLSGSLTLGLSRSSVDVSGIVGGFDPLTGSFCQPAAPCSISNDERNFIGNLSLRKRSELTTLNFLLGRSIAPRSDGTEVVQDQLRFYVDRTLTRKLNGTIGTVILQDSAVGRVFQPGSASATLVKQDRTYVTADARLSYRLWETLTVYGTYTYRIDKTDVTNGTVDKDNNRLLFGFVYRGVALRR